MKFSLTREEAEKLSGTIYWVLAATLPDDKERDTLKRIYSKLKVCLKSGNPNERIELEVR